MLLTIEAVLYSLWHVSMLSFFVFLSVCLPNCLSLLLVSISTQCGDVVSLTCLAESRALCLDFGGVVRRVDLDAEGADGYLL